MVRPLMNVQIEQWPRRTPVQITGFTWDITNVVVVTLAFEGLIGRGEASGVYYRKDSAEMVAQWVESVRGAVECGAGREQLQEMLPAGGARNALDCAFWDLESKLKGMPIWKMAGIAEPHPVQTAFTCHASSPKEMVAAATGYPGARAIKLKLTGEPVDLDRVRAVREALPDVWLGVDANQGFTLRFLETALPTLSAMNVSLIEQPLPVGLEQDLDGLHSPIPIAADESVQGIADVESLLGRFDVVNIKLDKCGGFTEALAMVDAVRDAGLVPMIGNMGGTSLAMAPGWLVGQRCAFADLDGPLFLMNDRKCPANYTDGSISCPEGLWGYP